MNSEQTQTEQTIEPRDRSRRAVLIGGGIVGVAVLGGAAFVASQLLNRTRAPAGIGGEQVIMQTGGEGAGQRTFEFKPPRIRRAPELPANEPDLVGWSLRRQDNSTCIGTG